MRPASRLMTAMCAESTDLHQIAVAIPAAIEGGLLLSQPKHSAWPLEAALDLALVPLHRASTHAATD